MRAIAFGIIVLQLLLLGPLFVMYGQVDPCRALAKEMALRAEAAGGLGVTVEDAFGDLEINARREVADRSTGQCYADIFSSWGGRVTGS
jgi:hypothetical protein